MKKILSLVVIFCFNVASIATTLVSNNPINKSKSITYNQEVSDKHELQINSSYGKITVNTWSENYLAIEVEIKVEGSDEKDVNKHIEAIDIDITTFKTTTKAVSKLPKVNTTWNFWGKKKQLKTEVNYIVHLPATNNLNIKHSYGEIHIDERYGDVSIQLDYGRFVIGHLHGLTNLSLDYVTKSKISYLNQSKIKADYSNFNVDTANEVKLLSDYSQVKFNKIADLSVASDYGKIEIDEVQQLNANIDYLTLEVKHLIGSAVIDADYGSITIKKLGYNFGEVDVNTNYTKVNVGAFPDASFNFNVFADYTSFKSDLDLNFNINEKKGISEKRITGYFGSQTNGNNLSINASYGSIRFN